MSAELPPASELKFGPASPVLDFKGRVLEINNLTPDEHCLGYIAINGALLKTVNEQLDPRWLRAEDDAGHRIEIGVLAPELSWPVVVGDRISVIVELEAPGFAALPRQQLTVRRESGELLGWFGEADKLEALHTPKELQLSLGDVTCLGHSNCSPEWAEYEIRARVDGDDRELSFGHHEKITLGDYAIVHGGVYKDLEGARCPESGIDNASAGLWRVR